MSNLPKIALVIQDDDPNVSAEILDLRKFFKSGEITLQDDGELRFTVHDEPDSDEIAMKRLSVLMDIMATQESDSLMKTTYILSTSRAARRKSWFAGLYRKLRWSQ